MPRTRRLLSTIARVVVLTLMAIAAVHVLIALTTLPSPPMLPASAPSTHEASWFRDRGGILQVQLSGTPDAIGRSHALLLRASMRENEEALWSVFREMIPAAPLRDLVLDFARLRFSGLDRRLGYARRLEIAAAADAFQPDPFAHELPTYQRFLFLNALYDVSLSFEGSPVVGCSSVVFSGARTRDGHTLLGRNFDFETHPVFDRGKAVLLFAENGKIPVLSVAWPGLAGVVSGLNAEGVAAVVHGGRASSPSSAGEPVLITIREALANASNVDDAVAWIRTRAPMVSHIVLLADASGAMVAVERAPGRPVHLRRGSEAIALTNHFEGPLADDPANLRVLANTSTRARRARLDELIEARQHGVTPADVRAVLRDRRAPGGEALPIGDRRAIDADIATHGVVMDLNARKIWVSQGPHLRGAFVLFDLRRWLADSEGMREDERVEVLESALSN